MWKYELSSNFLLDPITYVLENTLNMQGKLWDLAERTSRVQVSTVNTESKP
jgi:hypothetical protein